MTRKIQFWQWPNVLALDAGIISAVWLWVFATEQEAGPGLPAYAVLGLSVWLTYTADRLLDVRSREPSQLFSVRHQFAKFRNRRLWLIWTIVLFANITLALTALDTTQLLKGFALLVACLAYTALNQLLSSRFFPKELLVALIFAGGTQVFLPELSSWQCLTSFTFLCLTNCMLISWKEALVDARLQVRSMASLLTAHWTYPLLATALALSIAGNCGIALFPSVFCLLLLSFCSKRTHAELYRVLCDAALLAGPTFYFFWSGVFVR